MGDTIMLKIKDYDLKLSRVLVIILIAIVLTVGVTRALTTQPFTVNMGIYPGAPTYTVWEQDGTYYAKNSFGVIAYSGTDAVTIIDNTVALCSGSSLISLQGEIELDSTVTLADYVSITFDSIVITETDEDGLIVTSGANTVRGNIITFPDGYTASALKILNAQSVTVDINEIHVASGFGEAGSVAVHLLGDGEGCYHNTVHVGRIYGSETGVLLESANSGFCTVNKIVNTDIWMAGSVGTGNVYGYKFVADTTTSSNTIEGANCDDIPTDGYAYYNCGSKNPNYFIGCCTSDPQAGATAFYNPSMGYAHWTNGKLDGSATSTSINNAGYMVFSSGDLKDSAGIIDTGYLFLDNVLFNAENKFQTYSGTATILNGQSSVLVGINFEDTPTCITVTGRDAEVSNLYVSSVSAANFTINAADGAVSGDRAVYFYCEYQP
jgi:hypothetical protein